MSQYRPRAVLIIAVLFTAYAGAQQQAMSNFDRERMLTMLQVIGSDVRKHYYDPKFHGLNWDARLEEARQQIEKERSLSMALSHIAAALDSLNDSHTFFLPPQHVGRTSYGFQYQMIGDRCFITHVRLNSDADAKGVKPGDELLALNGYNVTRDSVWKMEYVYSVLRPQPGLHLQLQDPTGKQRTVGTTAKTSGGKLVTDLTGHNSGNDIWNLVRESENDNQLRRARYLEVGDQLLVLKVPEFFFSQEEVETMIGKARKHQNLIVDLRGNPGGAVDTLKYLVGGIFDKEIKIADRVGRKDSKPEVAKPLHSPYTGNLLVLVDSKSASCAEIFARLIQLEKRGLVIGDRSSGSVMEAKHYEEAMGQETKIFYGASITESDLIMSDRKSLEHSGVIPDEVVLPAAADIASGSDPVLAYAAKKLGVTLSAEDAGKAFVYEWSPE
jgi:C-terminal processing protease CtpA/Prc